MGRFLGKPRAKRGMKIFSSGEMSKVKGFERLYRYYWNKKAEEICSNVNYRKWTKTAIEGVIATEWALKKTPLIFSHSQRLLREYIKDPSRRRQKKGTVKEGALTMLNAHKNLLKLDENLRNLKSAANTSRNNNMKVQLTELKKRQEAVRKSLENMAKEKGVKNSEMIEKMENEVTTEQLDHTTIKTLIDAVVQEADCDDAVMDDVGLKGEDSFDGDEDDEKHSENGDNYEREDSIGETENDRQDGKYSVGGSDSDDEASDDSSDLDNEASDVSVGGSDLVKEASDGSNDLDDEASFLLN